MLLIVPTPIGNLEDITLRGIKALKEADSIICEDSRVTRKLMKLLEIETAGKFVDYMRNHQLNQASEAELDKISEDNEYRVVMVSDAGSPGLSDPGFLIIKLAIEKQIPYSVLPGSNALVPAVVGSGLVNKDFLFVGFLPTKKGRQKKLKEVSGSGYPVVLYESVHRVEKLISELNEYYSPQSEIAICREISKQFEEIVVSKLADLDISKMKLKGEFVVVIRPV